MQAFESKVLAKEHSAVTFCLLLCLDKSMSCFFDKEERSNLVKRTSWFFDERTELCLDKSKNLLLDLKKKRFVKKKGRTCFFV